MPRTISIRDARLERMRGNIDDQIQAPKVHESVVPEIKETPVVAPVTIDTEPIAQAMTLQAQMLSQAMQALKQEPSTPSPTKWNFRVTERDRVGNIVAFSAEAVE